MQNAFLKFDPSRVPSPCFVVDEQAVENNLKILARVRDESGAKVLLALKAFSMFSFAPLVRRYLDGCCASGYHEARLAREEFGGEVHTYSAAFHPRNFPEVLELSDHVVFNSLSQWQRHRSESLEKQQSKPSLQFGLRINPMHSEGAEPIYDPCSPHSRLGTVLSTLEGADLSDFSGLHFHTLCEQGFEPLARTLDAIESVFGHRLHEFKWLNFGGGHHITKPGYNVSGLIERIKTIQQKYKLQVYLEPGEAIAIHSGVLITEVLDVIHNQGDIAILDCSATCHMPDTLEMPYRAEILGGGKANEKRHTYRLGGLSCLAGDVMGDYSFDKPLDVGQRLMFDDMSHYTMVKTTTFNGVALPALAIWKSKTDELKLVKEFGYQDFKSRLS